MDALGSQSTDTSGKVQELQDALDDITEKLWELDKSWKNNLVFYGIKMDSGTDEHPSITEQKVSQIVHCVINDFILFSFKVNIFEFSRQNHLQSFIIEIIEN